MIFPPRVVPLEDGAGGTGAGGMGTSGKLGEERGRLTTTVRGATRGAGAALDAGFWFAPGGEPGAIGTEGAGVAGALEIGTPPGFATAPATGVLTGSGVGAATTTSVVLGVTTTVPLAARASSRETACERAQLKKPSERAPTAMRGSVRAKNDEPRKRCAHNGTRAGAASENSKFIGAIPGTGTPFIGGAMVTRIGERRLPRRRSTATGKLTCRRSFLRRSGEGATC